MTTENNKLIALFMNNAIVDNNNNHKDTYNYHNDWNWLMEVVEKIAPLISESEFKYRIGNDLLSVNKEGVYNACVEFIKWYSENSAQKE